MMNNTRKLTLSLSLFLLPVLASLSGCDEKKKPATPIPSEAQAGAGTGGAIHGAGGQQPQGGAKGAVPSGHPSMGGGAAASGPTGPVTEVIQAGTYTYLKLKTDRGEIWAAVPRCDHKVGDTVTIAGAMEMRDFESKTLGRKFPSIWFGTLGSGAPAAGGQAAAKAPAAMGAGGGHSKAGGKQVDKVDKATGEGAVTIGELYAQRKALAGKQIRVRGKVVRFNGGIMGKNWMHLQDGSGKVEDGSHDVAVTSRDTVKVGDVVTAIGKVGLDRDLGAGYHYDVLIEDAELQR